MLEYIIYNLNYFSLIAVTEKQHWKKAPVPFFPAPIGGRFLQYLLENIFPAVSNLS